MIDQRMDDESLDQCWKSNYSQTCDTTGKLSLFGTDGQPGGKKFGETCSIATSADRLLTLRTHHIPVLFHRRN